jgi:hypothetical protein
MTELLKAELQRIGDATPDVRVPAPDLWRRGRRARLRDRLLTTGAVIAALALLGGAAWVGLGGPHRTPPTDGSSAPGVPDHIYDIPARLTASADGSWPDGLESDLAIGRGAVAFVADHAVPVVITADGTYHLLQLPDLEYDDAYASSAWTPGRWLCLSPDGSELAYALPATATPPGIGVVDLRTGTVDRVVVELLTRIDVIGWSPDGRWLTWAGRTDIAWLGPTGRQAIGRRNLESGTQDEGRVRTWVPAIAVDNTGTVSLIANRRLRTWDGNDESGPLRLDGAASFSDHEVAAVSPDGTRLLGSSARGVAQLVDIGTGQTTQVTIGSPDSITPVGWPDADIAALYLRRSESGAGQVGLVTGSSLDGASYRRVVVVDPSTAGRIRSVSVATDLMNPEHPTVDRPEPDWPPTALQRLRPWGLALGALVVLLVLAWRWRGRRWRRLD